jgi:hypothetical protein
VRWSIFSVREDLKHHTADLDLGKHHPMSELLEQLIAVRMMGREAISDTALLKDGALTAFFDWDEIAHPSTFGRRLDRCGGPIIWGCRGL